MPMSDFFSEIRSFPVRSGEAVIELMYQAQLKPWWMLQPDLQYVIKSRRRRAQLRWQPEKETRWSSAFAHLSNFWNRAEPA